MDLFLGYPLKLFRDFVRVPIEAFLGKQYLNYKKKTNKGINSVKELFLKVCLLTVFLSAIMWISIFMYIIFYYIYMPNVTHIRPVHFQFRSCEENMGVCSFPSAHVQLTRWNNLLMPGQLYRIKLLLDMPESQVNKDLGMFMVCVQMRAKGGVFVSSSCRSAMLRYRRTTVDALPFKWQKEQERNICLDELTGAKLLFKKGSRLHEFIRTSVFAPLLLSGFDEERQQIQVELISDFVDDSELPVTDAYVELQSRFVQTYSSELHIQAHFSGLRYVMYYWPRISALVGISTNIFFVSFIFILSWYHLQDGIPEFIKATFGGTEVKNEGDDKKFLGKVKLERGSKESFPFFEDEAILEEFQRLEQKTT